MATSDLEGPQAAPTPSRNGRLPRGRAESAIVLMLLTCGTVEAARQIPICAGLTIVTAVSQPNGDYESIKRIESVDANEIRLKYTSEAPNTDLFATADEPIVRTTVYRRVLTEDLRSATAYQQLFPADADELIPGMTAIGTSTAVLESLESVGRSSFSISLIAPITPLRANRGGGLMSARDYLGSGTIDRIGTVTMPVIVNDQLVELTAIHARGEIAFETSEFFFLDDEENPLTLRMRLGVGAIPPMNPLLADSCAELNKAGVLDFQRQCLPDGGDRDTLQVIKITHQCEAPPLPMAAGGGPTPGAPGEGGRLTLPADGGAGTGSGGSGAGSGDGGAGGGVATASASRGGAAGNEPSALEQALTETGRADVYSIYFSFNSDVILEESEPTLAEIAALMRKYREWRLALHGHTDNIASDGYNLDLSRRRAAAAMRALTTRYGIAADRFTVAGYGESSPKDTNDTLEGRARNRRVELVRLP